MPASEFVLRRNDIEPGSGRPPLPGRHQPRDPAAGAAHPSSQSPTPPAPG